MEINKESLDAILKYDPDTGNLHNRIDRGRYKAGSIAGTRTAYGHIRLNVLGGMYFAHRLAWLTTHGTMPNGVIDHINGNPSDNRILNLRDVCHAENLQNQFRPSGNNPYLGVSLVRGRWQSVAMRFGYSANLGLFDTPEKASSAYQDAKKLSHEEFFSLAKSKRRKNKLTKEFIEILRSFPGFDCNQSEKEAWTSIKDRSLMQ